MISDRLPKTSANAPDGGRAGSLDEVVYRRHASRMFLPDKPVPAELLHEALTLAMRAPSNSNIQPWRLFIHTPRNPIRENVVLLES